MGRTTITPTHMQMSAVAESHVIYGFKVHHRWQGTTIIVTFIPTPFSPRESYVKDYCKDSNSYRLEQTPAGNLERWLIWYSDWLPSERSEVRMPFRIKTNFHCSSESPNTEWVARFLKKRETKGGEENNANYLTISIMPRKIRILLLVPRSLGQA
ncbi:hypothetical protein PoB_007401500 [Plakobranchus ocellatus]|uniref:Uncharacterized protein n=1 Tax=Plakobranchus ocellatus TaxID=259542 RepID=A0AAV4DU58_9GAST|nr:hypothetical protein PoB_007401500 [Plakobranchus ocellatus]